jgi:hypothetical protein
MRSLADIERRLDDIVAGRGAATSAGELLRAGEEVLEHWVGARDMRPTDGEREGFRLLALQRQGAQGDPTFNACRDTCRELVYHYNLMAQPSADPTAAASRLQMMALIANHLVLFVSGKMQEAGLGDFCCSSRPLHTEINDVPEVNDA